MLFYSCEANCGRIFNQLRSMQTHLSSARSCQWYLKGKLREWDVDEEDSQDQAEEPTEWEALQMSLGDEPSQEDLMDYDPHQDSDLDLEDLDLGPNDFQFIPQDRFSNTTEEEELMDEMEVGGPGPQTAANRLRALGGHPDRRVLDDDDDERVVVVEKDAGHVLRKETPPHSKICDEEGDIDMVENSFYPFNSELDWRIAQWAIKENPGHKAFDRLLSVPGVSTFCLASYFLTTFIRWLKNLGYRITIFVLFIRKWTESRKGQATGKLELSPSRIDQMMSSPCVSVTPSKQSEVSGRILISLLTWFTPLPKSTLMLKRIIASTLRCGPVNGGMFFRSGSLPPFVFAQ
jgi:hypothetical protein